MRGVQPMVWGANVVGDLTGHQPKADLTTSTVSEARGVGALRLDVFGPPGPALMCTLACTSSLLIIGLDNPRPLSHIWPDNIQSLHPPTPCLIHTISRSHCLCAVMLDAAHEWFSRRHRVPCRACSARSLPKHLHGRCVRERDRSWLFEPQLYLAAW